MTSKTCLNLIAIWAFVFAIACNSSKNIQESKTNETVKKKAIKQVKEFEGKIIYELIYKDRTGRMTVEQVKAVIGNQQIYTVKGKKYKNEKNGLLNMVQYYLGQDTLYSQIAGQLHCTDTNSNPETLVDFKIEEKVDTIAGIICDLLSITLTEGGTIKYYFNRDYHVNPNHYEKHEYGFWKFCTEKTNSLPIKQIHDTKVAYVELTAKEIKKISIDDAEFELPNLPRVIIPAPSQQSSSNEKAMIKTDTIPFELTKGNNIKFKTILNKTDTLDLFFDTGGTEIVMLHSSIKEKTTLLKDKNSSYKEENYVPLEELNTLSIGSMTWDSLTIYPVSIGPKEMDGHFGWNLFKNKIVELDYDKNLMIIHHSPPIISKDYTKVDLEYINTLFCIQGDLEVDGKTYTNRYLFDTGFQRAIVLDKDLRAEEKFPTDLPVLKESKLKNSVGTVFVNKVVNTNKVCFANACAKNVPAQLIVTPNPARFKTHILGNELLKRFNTIFDFPNKVVYLKPNQLMSLPYADAS